MEDVTECRLPPGPPPLDRPLGRPASDLRLVLLVTAAVLGAFRGEPLGDRFSAVACAASSLLRVCGVRPAGPGDPDGDDPPTGPTLLARLLLVPALTLLPPGCRDGDEDGGVGALPEMAGDDGELLRPRGDPPCCRNDDRGLSSAVGGAIILAGGRRGTAATD